MPQEFVATPLLGHGRFPSPPSGCLSQTRLVRRVRESPFHRPQEPTSTPILSKPSARVGFRVEKGEGEDGGSLRVEGDVTRDVQHLVSNHYQEARRSAVEEKQ